MSNNTNLIILSVSSALQGVSMLVKLLTEWKRTTWRQRFDVANVTAALFVFAFAFWIAPR